MVNSLFDAAVPASHFPPPKRLFPPLLPLLQAMGCTGQKLLLPPVKAMPLCPRTEGMHGRKGSLCGQGIHLGTRTRTPSLTELPNQVVLTLHPNDPWPHGCMQAQTGELAATKHQTCPGLGWKAGGRRMVVSPCSLREGCATQFSLFWCMAQEEQLYQEMCGSCLGCFELLF